MGTGGPFPGGKARPGRDADHSPPSSAEVMNEQELYLLSPPKRLVVSSDTALAFNFVKKCLETVSDCNMIPVLRLTLL